MPMNILVIGGTYFLGRAFVDIVKEKHCVTVLNRGNVVLSKELYKNVKQYICDRHDEEKISHIKDEDFDVVVDFCAYNKGDIDLILRALDYNIKQYIFISTCDVYKRGSGAVLDENAQLEERRFGGEAGDYISGKVALEKEIRRCTEHEIYYTVIRPAIIYGPGNYAPRESMFFNWIVNAGQILYPIESAGHFQMVYVEDVAKIISDLCLLEEAYNESFNVCGKDIVNYDSFVNALRNAVYIPFEKIEVSSEMIEQKNIPLPFAIHESESETYSDAKLLKRGVRYTSLEEGLKKSFSFYMQEESGNITE